MLAILMRFGSWLAGGFLVTAFGGLAKFLLSGIIAQIVVKIIMYVVIFGAIFLFYKNFAATSLDYALSFFSFFGFDGVVAQIQYYFDQLPRVVLDVFAYFEIGALVAFLINNYISSIFLAWIMRRFG
jgi:hypothetical protein